jgi:hypothetical protein
LKISWIRRVAPTNQEATRPLRKKEDQGMVVEITITLKGNPKGENIEAQIHPLPGSIRGMGWMN